MATDEGWAAAAAAIGASRFISFSVEGEVYTYAAPLLFLFFLGN